MLYYSDVCLALKHPNADFFLYAGYSKLLYNLQLGKWIRNSLLNRWEVEIGPVRSSLYIDYSSILRENFHSFNLASICFDTKKDNSLIRFPED